jgi:glycogenin glucosyltransferase
MNCYVTLASDEFIPGAICLIKSLRRFTETPFVVIDIGINDIYKKRLVQLGATMLKVEPISSIHAKNQPWHTVPNFANNCFNKLYLWNLKYDKVIYLDSDMLVVKSIDHLFNIDYSFSACPSYVCKFDKLKHEIVQSGWSNSLFNGGFLVIKPNEIVFQDLMSKKDIIRCDRDPSDQGFLNEYYKDRWNKLSPIYNATRRVFMVDCLKWNQIKNDIHVIHFTVQKPWITKVQECEEIENLWWECYDS